MSYSLIVSAVAVLVRDVLRNPVRSAPCSHHDDFAPRWESGGMTRWSV